VPAGNHRRARAAVQLLDQRRRVGGHGRDADGLLRVDLALYASSARAARADHSERRFMLTLNDELRWLGWYELLCSRVR
jgi:hypothetical protein